MKFVSSFGKLLKLFFKCDIARFVHRISLLMPNVFNFNRFFYMERELFDFSNSLNDNVIVLVAGNENIEEIVRISKRNKEKIEYLLNNNVMVLISKTENDHLQVRCGQCKVIVMWLGLAGIMILGIIWHIFSGHI